MNLLLFGTGPLMGFVVRHGTDPATPLCMVFAFYGKVGPDSKRQRIVGQNQDVLFCAGAPAYWTVFLMGDTLVYTILTKYVGTMFQYAYIQWNL
jgi:hypothetical protein